MNTWKVIATALCILILILVAGYMQGCSSQESEESKNGKFIVYKDSGNTFLNNNFIEAVDKETGVHYLVIDGGYGIAVCPMYNTDGTIKTEEAKQ